MTSSKTSPAPPPPPHHVYYHPIPSDSQPHQPPYVIVLPHYPHTSAAFRRQCRRRIFCAFSFVLIAAAIFFLWPSDPEVSVVRLRLQRLRIHTFPTVYFDLTLDLTARVRNRDFYSVDYQSLVVSIGYRGKQLGHVVSDGGHLRARGSSYINATLNLDRVELFSDVIPLVEDLAKGSITFDTTTKIGGQLGLFVFELPLEGKVSCEIIVNTRNETITRQSCYPE